MQAWAPIPDDEVAERGPLYDSYIVQERQIVEDVSEYPLEEHLYTEDGQRVERQRPIPAPDGHTFLYCGVLQHLAEASTHFVGYDSAFLDDSMYAFEGADLQRDEEDSDENDFPPPSPDGPGTSPRFSGYPQAFLNDIGQWQADGVMRELLPLLWLLTLAIRSSPGNGPCFIPIKSQAYTTWVHMSRASKRKHVAANGIVSGAVAGAFASGKNGFRTAKKLYKDLVECMPSKRVYAQAQRAVKTGLRFENLISIELYNVDQMKIAQDGFEETIIRPLMSAILHPSVVDAIRSVSFITVPRVGLSLYKSSKFICWTHADRRMAPDMARPLLVGHLSHPGSSRAHLSQALRATGQDLRCCEGNCRRPSNLKSHAFAPRR